MNTLVACIGRTRNTQEIRFEAQKARDHLRRIDVGKSKVNLSLGLIN
jgi:hypothetical protein